MRTPRSRLISILLVITASAAAPVLAADRLFEFFNTGLNHYFLTIDPAEGAAIDSGAAGPGWQRTGATIAAWRSAAVAPAGAVTVCRFFGNQANGGPNSHFYTADAGECASVKTDPGWSFERNEFLVTLPQGGVCSTSGMPDMAGPCAIVLPRSVRNRDPQEHRQQLGRSGRTGWCSGADSQMKNVNRQVLSQVKRLESSERLNR